MTDTVSKPSISADLASRVGDGQVVGAVGVSGGHYTEDMQVAEAGINGA